ncbi:hypothetical protein [Defluviimonas salinarum]|uniref:Core-binding (CB) domain-containing protein n=1 Tax=Defluviimonas salinarum TaxID=2992147 RepID=A0ABT3J0T3_9RHOB|nr:hypothetical protein [Defluviimonas salinarum]MCW3781044.1 hypothetical protein [Defluviimonas salinarum]
MGTIIERRRKDGTALYRAQIVIKQGSKIVHQESSSFDRRTTAASWLKKREKELKAPGGLAAAKVRTGTIGEIGRRYVSEKRDGIGKTKAQVLRSIERDFSISDIRSDELCSEDIATFARTLSEGRAPSTVQNYLSHLSAALDLAGPAWGYDIDRNAVGDGVKASRQLGSGPIDLLEAAAAG